MLSLQCRHATCNNYHGNTNAFALNESIHGAMPESNCSNVQLQMRKKHLLCCDNIIQHDYTATLTLPTVLPSQM